jgi:hypothetical protein
MFIYLINELIATILILFITSIGISICLLYCYVFFNISRFSLFFVFEFLLINFLIIRGLYHLYITKYSGEWDRFDHVDTVQYSNIIHTLIKKEHDRDENRIQTNCDQIDSSDDDLLSLDLLVENHPIDSEKNELFTPKIPNHLPPSPPTPPQPSTFTITPQKEPLPLPMLPIGDFVDDFRSPFNSSNKLLSLFFVPKFGKNCGKKFLITSYISSQCNNLAKKLNIHQDSGRFIGLNGDLSMGDPTQREERDGENNNDDTEPTPLRLQTPPNLYRTCKQSENCYHIAPPRSHHCKQCSKCHILFDHRCVFFNCCITHQNRRSFILFLLYTLILMIWIWINFDLTGIDISHKNRTSWCFFQHTFFDFFKIKLYKFFSTFFSFFLHENNSTPQSISTPHLNTNYCFFALNHQIHPLEYHYAPLETILSHLYTYLTTFCVDVIFLLIFPFFCVVLFFSTLWLFYGLTLYEFITILTYKPDNVSVYDIFIRRIYNTDHCDELFEELPQKRFQIEDESDEYKNDKFNPYFLMHFPYDIGLCLNFYTLFGSYIYTEPSCIAIHYLIVLYNQIFRKKIQNVTNKNNKNGNNKTKKKTKNKNDHLITIPSPLSSPPPSILSYNRNICHINTPLPSQTKSQCEFSSVPIPIFLLKNHLFSSSQQNPQKNSTNSTSISLPLYLTKTPLNTSPQTPIDGGFYAVKPSLGHILLCEQLWKGHYSLINFKTSIKLQLYRNIILDSDMLEPQDGEF